MKKTTNRLLRLTRAIATDTLPTLLGECHVGEAGAGFPNDKVFVPDSFWSP